MREEFEFPGPSWGTTPGPIVYTTYYAMSLIPTVANGLFYTPQDDDYIFTRLGAQIALERLDSGAQTALEHIDSYVSYNTITATTLTMN